MAVFKRVLRLTVGKTSGLLIEDNKIEFNIEKSRASYPNIAKISVYNLKPTTRQLIKDEFEQVQLEGGYLDSSGVLFHGQIRNVIHRRDGVDIITDIYCGDGDIAFRQSIINETIPAGQNSPKDLVNLLISNMGDVTAGIINGLDGLQSNTRAVTLNGNVKDELDKLGRKHDFAWSIQNGQVDIVPNKSAIDDITLISAQTGMIGNPSVTEVGLTVKTLLNHKLLPNRQIKVLSEFKDINIQGLNFAKRDTDIGGGIYRINKVTHSGDNRSGEFVSSVEAIANVI